MEDPICSAEANCLSKKVWKLLDILEMVLFMMRSQAVAVWKFCASTMDRIIGRICSGALALHTSMA